MNAVKVLPPSGAQLELRQGDQRAVVVEVGGGLRSYEVGRRRILDGYPEHVMAGGGRGQVLFPWPNRLAAGRWEHDGHALQLPLSEPGRGNAIHGLVRWSQWQLEQDGPAGAVARHTLMPLPGYPFRMSVQIRYRLGADGLTVATTVGNESARPAPFGLGFHPYIAAGDGLVDDLTLTVPAATQLLLDGNGIPTGRKPAAVVAARPALRAAHRCRPDRRRLHRPGARQCRPGARHHRRADRQGAALGRSGLRLPAGLHRRHASGGGEAPRRGDRADDQPG